MRHRGVSVGGLLGVSLPVLIAGGLLLYRCPDTRVHLARAWLAVTCHAQPEAISEVEIFGHVNGPCAAWVEEHQRRWTPGTSGERFVMEDAEFRVPVITNSLGLRNKEYPLKKPPGVRRVVLLGDSFVYGFGVEADAAVFARLAAELGQRCENPIEVWGVAAVGWNTVIEYLVAQRKIPAFDPDLVVLFFDGFDPEENLIFHERAKFDEGELQSVEKDFDGRVVKPIVSELIEPILRGDLDPKRFETMISVSNSYLSKIRAVFAARGIPVLVVSYPREANPERSAVMRRKLLPIQAYLSQAGIPWMSLFDRIGKTEFEQYYFPINEHWNEAGNRFIANVLAEYLNDRYSAAIGCRTRP